MSTFRPLLDNVIVEREEEETTSSGGIVLPGSAKEKPNSGMVLSVGPGAINTDGSTRPMGVKAGDKVIFGKYADSNTVAVDGKELLIISEKDIYAIVED